MKPLYTKISLILFILAFSVQGVLAQTASPSVSPTLTPKLSPTVNVEQKEIQNIKEKVATKVAELRRENNKAVGGTVTTISGNTITIKTEDDQTFTIKLDESLTKIFQVSTGQKKELKATDLKKDQYIIATGVTNDKTIDANFIYQDDLFLVRTGKVSEVNKEDNSLKVITTEKDTFTLDIESFTKITLLNVKTFLPEVSGFSKMKEGDTVHFVVKKSAGSVKEVNRYPALKILVIPQEFFVK